MLIQEKYYVQVKYMCYNVVNQMYSRPRKLVDRRYFLLCFTFMRSYLYGYSFQDTVLCDK